MSAVEKRGNPATELQSGAPDALRWISEREAEARKHFEDCQKRLRIAERENLERPADKDGFDFQKAEDVARGHLLAAGREVESLQKRLLSFDTKITPERRDGSDKLSKEEVKRILFLFVIHEREAGHRLVTSLCSDFLACTKEVEIYEKYNAKFEEVQRSAMESAVREEHLPEWVRETVINAI